MLRRPMMWFALSLLCMAGAWFFWKWGDAAVARRKQATPPAPIQQRAVRAESTVTTPQSTAIPLLSAAAANRPATNTSPLAYRLSNSPRPYRELLRDDHAVLLENAVVDTAQASPLVIPPHLRAAGEPGAYIVQSRRELDNAFRAALKNAGATIISYIPNNAYLVRASATAAAQLAALPQTQSVLAYEPYYKVRTTLLPLAVNQAVLPEGALLNLVLFADTAAATTKAVQDLGAQVLVEDRSPFGPVLRVKPAADSLVALAGLSGVQTVEWAYERVRANDVSRVRIGVATNTVIATSNYLGLTGANIVVGVTDEGVDGGHPDLVERVRGDLPQSLLDLSGHGTHVATTIAGSGGSSLTVTGAPPGSVTNADFRGRAPAARIFSTRYTGTNAPNTPFLPDAYLQEIVSRTNVYIANNSWGYNLDNTYSISAASYDAAVRDAEPGTTGSQPLVYVFSAGNNGAGSDGGIAGDAGSIVSPGTAKNVITVGAIEQLRDITNAVISNCITNLANVTNGNVVTVVTNIVCDTNRPFADATDSETQVAAYSSRGNVGIGTEGDFGRFKPDVVAPGTMVVSGRSRQWETNAYYDPISVTANSLVNVTIDQGSNFLNQIFIPNNAVRVVIRVFANAASPTPFPDTPIFVRQPSPPTAASPRATNVFAMPGNLALTPVGTTWYYRVVNASTQELSLDIVTTIFTISEDSDAKLVLQTLNDSIGPNYRFESGTSMAAAEVSGTLALMQEFFEQDLGVTVSPALLKASLINGARPAGPAYDLQVDNTINYQGWGAINLVNSLPDGATNGIPHGGATRGAASVQFFDQNPQSALATGSSQTRKFEVSPDGTLSPLRVTLVWTDPPGNPAAATKLVNDLDLVVTNLDTGDVYFGNQFDTGSNFTTPWDTNEVAGVDIVNNVENVYIPPDLGTNYSVTVRARRVNVNAVTEHTDNTVQDYALIVSCGSGEVPQALTLVEPGPLLGDLTPEITFVTNTFQSAEASGFLLGNQLAGANTPLLGTTNGIITQWHFYVVTNTTTFSNAAFVTFLPSTLSVPRLGVRERDVDNATRVQADIDLYVSTSPALLSLDPATLAAADKSTRRGGTEQVILSNSAQNVVYFIGVKSEDQMACEYAFFGVFSLLPFDDANGTVRCFPTPVLIPDRSPASVSRIDDAAMIICPCGLEGQTRRVVVTNIITHENLGDVVGNLAHNDKFAVLNNHRPAPVPPPSAPGPYYFIYEDNQEYVDAPAPYYRLESDGPGSLRDFVGEERLGPWILTFIDDSLTQTGLVDFVSLLVEEQDIDDSERFLAPNTFTFDFIDVPADATNLTVCVSQNTALLELYVRRGGFPSRNVYDYFTTIPSGGGCLTITPQDLPPLAVGRYYIGVYNPNAVGQTIRLLAFVIRAPAVDNSLKFSSSDEIPIIDDGVTYASIFNPNFGLVGDVKVGLRIDHPRISDLAITLVSPRGTRVLLTENRGRTNTMGFGSSFSITNVVPASSSGGAAAYTNTIDTGTTEGFITVDYNFLCASDRMTVYYDGALIFDSGYINNGCPSGQSVPRQFRINYGPGFSTSLTIVMNEGGNPTPTTLWSYTASAVQNVHNYLVFTEDTELTTTPIKYGQPPFIPTGSTSNYLISTFDGSTVQDYFGPTIVDGWDVITSNRVEVVNGPANAGPNSLAMHDGALRRALPTKKGKTYGLSYAYRRNSLFDGLVSWWPAEDSYEDVVDGNEGNPVNQVSFTNGFVGKTFVFDGNQDAVNVGTNANLHLQDFTIEAWVKRSSATNVSFNGNGNGEIFVVGTNPGGLGFRIQQSDNALTLGRSGGQQVTSTALVTDTNWHHVAVTKLGTVVVFYLDSVASAPAAYTDPPFTFNAPAYIGAWQNTSTQIDNSFFGAIDELAVYNRPLSPAEISMIYLAGSAGKCVPSLPPVIRPDNSAALGFSTNSNPSGVWSYGFSTNLTGTFIPYVEAGSNGDFEFWRTNLLSGAPNVIHNPSGSPVTSTTVTLGANQLAFHPGPNGQVSIIRYTCPTNDNYQLVATFGGADTVGPTTTDVHILRNGVSIFDGLVNAFGAGPNFSTNLNLIGGELIDFVVGWGTNSEFSWDTTTISAIIVPTTGCETSPTVVAAGGVTNQIRGTTEWQTNAVIFIATSNSTPIYAYAEEDESDVLVDSFVVTEPPDGLYFLPEESLKAFEGEIAFGFWRLEILDTRSGAVVPQPRLLSWQLDFLYQQFLPVPGRILPGDCNTATVPPGQIRYYAIDVPTFVRAATNRLTFASSPLNVLYNETIPPTGTNSLPPDYMLITNATVGSYTLTTNDVPAPVLKPGRRYFLGVQNPGTNTVVFTLCIDFDLNAFPPFVDLTNGVPYCAVNPGPSDPFDYYRFVVSSNSVRAQFELTSLSDDMVLLLRRGLPPTFSVFDYYSANPYTNDEVITVFDFSQPVPLTPGDWFFAAVNITAQPVSYCATATEWPVYGTNIVIVKTEVTTNGFCLTWTSLAGVPYHVEGKTSLNDTNWAIVSPTVRATGPLTTYCVPLPSAYRFFRVVEGIAINPFVPAPRFVSITRTSDGYVLVWTGNAAYQYELQWSPTVPATIWTPFVPPVSSFSGRFSFLDDGSQTGGLGATRYYRLLQLP